MKKPLIYILLLILAALVFYILLGDIFSGNIKKSSNNPYAYDLGDIHKIDPALIKYREIKRIALSQPKPKALHYSDGYLAIGYENHFQVIDTTGREIHVKSISGPITAIIISPEKQLCIASKNQIDVFDLDGASLIQHWEIDDSSTYITGLAVHNSQILIADAGNAMVHIYTMDGVEIGNFDGKNRTDSKHGFIIPSPYFDLAFDADGQLWTANTGIQAIENYSPDGTLRSYWGKSSYELSGFIGCCNPAHFCILSNGNFITCEKGLVRIKEYLPSGELSSVVATPEAFDTNSEPADLTSDESGAIYALDITRNMIRKFERTEN